MTIEESVFARCMPDRKLLLARGFREDADGSLSLSEDILSGSFKASVRISGTHAEGKVSDAATGEEYVLVHVENAQGAFVAKVRSAYRAWLEEIAGSCCLPLPFLGKQANRIAAWIFDAFGEKPDFPFKDDKADGTFRLSGTRKWYAVVLLVEKAKVGLQGEGKVEVLNLKADPEERDGWLSSPGIVPAYHMNKKAWISVILDGPVPDDLVQELVRESRDLVKDKDEEAHARALRYGYRKK